MRGTVVIARSAENRPARPSRNGRRTAAGPDPSSKITLTVTDVQRFLGKSKRAFYLLRRDWTEEFPAPFLMQGRDHWLMRDLLEWIESRRRRDAIPGRTVLSSTARPAVPTAPEA
jgi:predicted DNA-binding transcriptional regulator AlpA